jgi:RimJ/RimL family protein N-acetyltransferase
LSLASLPVGEPVGGGPAVRPARRVLTGRQVALRPLQLETDPAELFRISHGDPGRERLWTYMGYGPFSGETAMGEWLAGCARSEDPLFLCVIDAANGRRLGMASFLNVRPEMRVLEVGHIWYAPEAQRTAANTEATYLMLRDAFDLGYRRAEWKCDALNERSRRAALRLGFRFEGVFRQHMVVKDRNRDTAWYAVLDGEWPAVRTNLERWLAAPPAGRFSLTEASRSQAG